MKPNETQTHVHCVFLTRTSGSDSYVAHPKEGKPPQQATL